MTRKSLLVVLALSVSGLAVFLVSTPEADAILLQGSFVDDNQSPHQDGIEAIAARGITRGCNHPANDRFCPNRDTTRAEAATFMARAYNYLSDGQDYFVDDNGHPLEDNINRIAAAGITVGCNPPDNDRFCPDQHMTRAQFATFLTRALDLPATSTDYFTDDDGHGLENAINAIAGAGITVGCNAPSNTWFCPNRSLTRGETATFLARALSLDNNPQRIPLTEWDPISCNKDGVNCNVNIQTFSGRSHLIREGLFQLLPYGPEEETEFLAGGTGFRLTLNGSPLSLTEEEVSTNSSSATRMWNTTLTFPEGDHVLVGEWHRGGELIQRTTAFLDVD